MALTDAELKKALLDLSYVTEEECKKAEQQAKLHDCSLKDAFFELSILNQEIYESVIAEHYHLPYFNLEQQPPTPELVDLLPEDIARSYNAIVVAQDDTKTVIATSDPSNKLMEEAMRKNIGQKTPLFPDKEEADKKKTNRKTAAGGHFGRDDADFTWEKTDIAAKLKEAAKLEVAAR